MGAAGKASARIVCAVGALVIVGAAIAVACGDSGSPGQPVGDAGAAGSDTGAPPPCTTVSTFSGVVACDADAGGALLGTCAISMPVQGGIAATLCEGNGVVICGSSHDDAGVSELDWNVRSGGAKLDSQISINLATRLQVDQLGTVPASIDIVHTLPDDGGTEEWMTPDGGCTITIGGSVCEGKSGDRLLSGTGTCTQPAAPKSGTSAPAITISDFTFIDYF
jgi:hypothetical protein